jgi:hypothetical protein
VNALREQPGGLAELLLAHRFFFSVGGIITSLTGAVDEAFPGL